MTTNNLSYSGVVYASTRETSEGSRLNLTDAVERLLSTANEDPAPRILWSMSYNEKGRAPSTTVPAAFAHDESGQIMTFPHKSLDLAFDDALVDSVKGIWKKIMGSNADDVEFLRFEERENIGDDGVDDE
jgi:Rab proteins geranylgeranyltransferase component A